MQFEKSKTDGMPCVKIYGRYHGEKTFPSLNNLLAAYGSTPYKGNAMKQKFQNICVNEVRTQLRKYKAEKPIIIHYYIYEPHKGKIRDVGNIVAMIDKCVQDSLVKAGIIVDDNPKYVKNFTHDIFYTEATPGFEVYIEEVDYE